jgi:hypothetical protein
VLGFSGASLRFESLYTLLKGQLLPSRIVGLAETGENIATTRRPRKQCTQMRQGSKASTRRRICAESLPPRTPQDCEEGDLSVGTWKSPLLAWIPSFLGHFGHTLVMKIKYFLPTTYRKITSLRSQIATSNGRGGRRYLQRAFTEQGVAMLSSVLNSEQAIQVNIAIMRAFVRMDSGKMGTLSSTFQRERKRGSEWP